MKRFLLASVGVLAMVGLANAADLPRPVYTKAPPYQAPYAYNWTGFYIGINGGGGWGNSTWDSTGGFDTSGGMVGGTVGYNWQMGTWVLGVEGDIDWADIKGTTATNCVGGGCTTQNNWLGTARGRVGYAFDRWLPYLTGGAAFGDVQASHPGFEYLHYDLGSFQCGLNCNGFVSDNVNFHADVIRGGLNLRF